MRFLLIVLMIVAEPHLAWGQQASQEQQNQGTAPGSAPPIETQRIDVAASPEPQQPSSEVGYMNSAQVKDLLHRIWLAQFRINDLLSQVHPEHWKIEEGTRNSFNQTLDSLHKALATEEQWRTQFDGRPGSLYLGFLTYVAISAVLPRLQGVALSVSRYENASFGGQCSQAGLHLFDLQQTLQSYLLYLLRNQDEVLYATQTNLAGCQNELGYALRGQAGQAKPMKNIAPKFKGHPRSRRKTESRIGRGAIKDQTAVERKAEGLVGVKPEAKKEPSKTQTIEKRK
jgi:hypothetical protein